MRRYWAICPGCQFENRIPSNRGPALHLNSKYADVVPKFNRYDEGQQQFAAFIGKDTQMENMNHSKHTNTLDYLRSKNHIRTVHGEEGMTPVAVLFAASLVSREEPNGEQGENARQIIHRVMEAAEVAGYDHGMALETLLNNGTPTKHCVDGRYFGDVDELDLVLAMCEEAVSLLPQGAFADAVGQGRPQ